MSTLSPLRDLLPVWEVFDCRTGRAVGFARADHHLPAIHTIAGAARLPGRYLDASLVPIESLDLVPDRLPAILPHEIQESR